MSHISVPVKGEYFSHVGNIHFFPADAAQCGVKTSALALQELTLTSGRSSLQKGKILSGSGPTPLKTRASYLQGWAGQFLLPEQGQLQPVQKSWCWMYIQVSKYSCATTLSSPQQDISYKCLVFLFFFSLCSLLPLKWYVLCIPPVPLQSHLPTLEIITFMITFCSWYRRKLTLVHCKFRSKIAGREIIWSTKDLLSLHISLLYPCYSWYWKNLSSH